MQNLKNFLLAILLIQCILCFSQSSEKFVVDSLPYPARYEKLKGLYLKRLESESYKKTEKIKWDYFNKIHNDASDSEEYNKLVMLEWTKTHLYKTDFGSPEEAESEYKNFEEALTLETVVNKEYWHYLLTCIAAGFYDIDKEIQEEVKKEHPEKFPVRAYKKRESYIPKIAITPK